MATARHAERLFQFRGVGGELSKPLGAFGAGCVVTKVCVWSACVSCLMSVTHNKQQVQQSISFARKLKQSFFF